MAKCDLEIVLDHPDKPYKPGEKLSGFVGVTVNAGCTCNALTLACQWRTHGSGNDKSGPAQVQTLYTGSWTAGEQHVHPFEITVPNGPLTYHGHHLNVDWYLDARADIPWALDPKAKTEFVLVDDPSVPLDHGPLQKTGATRGAGLGSGIGTAVGLGFIVFAGIFLAVGAAAVAHGDLGTGLPFVLVPLVFVAVGLFIVTRWLRNVLASRRLGPVELAVDPDHVRGGDTLNVHLQVTPRTTVALAGVNARLHAEERCVSGSGTNRHTHLHTVFDRTVALQGPRTLEPGAPVALAGQLQMPPDPAPSFAATDEALHWRLEVTVDTQGWLDWKGAWELEVRP